MRDGVYELARAALELIGELGARGRAVERTRRWQRPVGSGSRGARCGGLAVYVDCAGTSSLRIREDAVIILQIHLAEVSSGDELIAGQWLAVRAQDPSGRTARLPLCEVALSPLLEADPEDAAGQARAFRQRSCLAVVCVLGSRHEQHRRAFKGDDVAIREAGGARGLRAIEHGDGSREGDVEVLRRILERRAARQVEDAAVLREDEHSRPQQLLAHELHELMRRVDLHLPLADDLQPRQRGGLILISPMCGGPVLGDQMHRLRPNLHLEGLCAHQHRRVQRAVPVGLRRGDIVFERARQRSPAGVHLAEDVIAEGILLVRGVLPSLRPATLPRVRRLLRLRAEHDAERDEVMYPLNAALVPLHLLEGRIDGLGTTADVDGAQPPLQPRVAQQHILDRRLRILKNLLVFDETRGDLLRQPVVFLGKEVLEREIGQLRLILPHAEAVGEWREDLESLARDRRPLLHRHVLQRAHVVHAVGELHDDDAPVVRHRDEHGAHILHLFHLFGSGVVKRPQVLAVNRRAHHLRQLAHLGLALDDLAHRVPEERLDLVER
mmetsp:Transcript_22065/g.56341  ORF Transcript_22065/g.56341 Transcript_22065/m.56341 type:complete len:553 (-) Transcript_22065:541-2199(-)